MLRPLLRRPTTLQSSPFFRPLSSSAHSLGRSQSHITAPAILQVKQRPEAIASKRMGASSFHSTPRREAAPVIVLLASVLKASTAIEFAHTAGRIAMTFVPVILFKNHKTRRFLQVTAQHGIPASEEKKTLLMKRLKNRTILFHALLFTPVLLFWAAIVASLEQTPLTGRWRMIILSPEEEDGIAAQLAGNGWYQAVSEILAHEGTPKWIPADDWRYIWVRDTLRRLEATIPLLQYEGEINPEWLYRDPDDIPLPPPPEHPLKPRPRAARQLCELVCTDKKAPQPPQKILGPPYSLLLVDNPDACNAFSYGFGPDGAAGIVVYSGFLDDILSRLPPDTTVASEPENKSWWSSLFGAFYPRQSPPRHPSPSAEQTSQLAILLSHELSHLILSHHLETLSSGTIIVPGVISMAADIIRVLIFPITMMFGPFVNDAVAQLGKVGSGELSKVGEYCTSVKQEIEADVVSARLLAYAGFDARDAVSFWENRQLTAKTAECSATKSSESLEQSSIPNLSLVRRITGADHPVNEVRVERLKAELVRWEIERRAWLHRLQNPGEKSSVVLATA